MMQKTIQVQEQLIVALNSDLKSKEELIVTQRELIKTMQALASLQSTVVVPSKVDFKSLEAPYSSQEVWIENKKL